MRLCVLLSLLVPTLAVADEPKFDFAKPDETKSVQWTIQAKGGLVLTSGNSRMVSGSIGFLLARRDPKNRFSLEGNYAFAKSSVLVAVDTNGNKQVDPGEDQRVDQTTANLWNVKGRYDRFFTTNNSGYVSANAGGDAVAGKDLAAGGQIGYSRQLYHSDDKVLVGEIGYDFSYELYSATPQGTQIHSARIFAGYTGKLSENTNAYVSVEALFNLNEEKTPNASDGSDRVGPFRDTRVVGKIGAASNFYKNCSLSIGFTLKYDDNPALRPALSIPYAAGYAPFADKLDTLLEAALVVNFI